MTWWIIWLLATLGTLGAKWYLTRATERLRSNLSRQQREALETKGQLVDAVQNHHAAVRLTREREASIKRIRTNIVDLENEIERRKAEKRESASSPGGQPRL
jgi:hypothetical protein